MVGASVLADGTAVVGSSAAPQLSQNASPGTTVAPQFGHVAAVTVG
jgi:hypothetical protein